MSPDAILKHTTQGLHFLQWTHGPGVPVVRHALESMGKLAMQALVEAEKLGAKPEGDRGGLS